MITTWTGAIAEGMPEFLVTIESWPDDHVNYPNRPLRVTVEDARSGEMILEWDDNPQITHWVNFDSFVPDMGLYLVDLNFDGYRDILWYEYIGLDDTPGFDEPRCVSYVAHLWDAEKAIFTRFSSFDMESPIVDENRQAILSYTSGNDGEVLNYLIFKFENNRFYQEAELIISKNFKSAENKYEWGFRDRRVNDGKFEVVAQFFAKSDTKEDPPVEAAEYFEPGSYWDLNNPIWNYWEQMQ